MLLKNLHEAESWFQVLQTAARTQTAVMNLAAGQASGDTAEAHPHSDQVLLVLSGEVQGEVGGEHATLREGDVVLIPAGVKHRFANQSAQEVRTFSVYAGPAYPAGEKG